MIDFSDALTLTWGKPGGRMYVNWKEPFFGATVSVNSDGRVTSCAHREPLNNREFCLGSKCKELLDLNFGKHILLLTPSESVSNCVGFFRF